MKKNQIIQKIIKSKNAFILFIFSFSLVGFLFAWQGHKGFSLWDEGFLWYGAQRVMLGEVPIRDFQAYDPGRYYWAASLMSLFGGNGILELRAAVAVFQALGLFVALMLIAGTFKKQEFLYMMVSAITLLVWMFPPHKIFDISLSIILIGVLSFLIQNPQKHIYFFAGVCVGVVAVFGRNHGVYGVAASLGVMIWMSIKRTQGIGLLKGLAIWSSGVFVGFSPILLMVLVVPEFAAAFWDSIQFLFEFKATNIPLPTPWPWLVKFNATPLDEAIRAVLIGLFFIATIVFAVLSITWLFWKKMQNRQYLPVTVAASFLAFPYAHYAFSRADVSHLAQGIFPFLIGSFTLLSSQKAQIKWSFTIIIFLASVYVMHVFHPGWELRFNKNAVDVKISGSHLQVDAGTASDIALLRDLSAQYISNGQSFISAPFWPGSYALLERKSPMWGIYPLFPRSYLHQVEELERIKKCNIGFAIILDFPLDGREDLRFKNTTPLIYQHILDNYDPIPHAYNPLLNIFKARGNFQ